jgi:hypothetical protein
MADPAHAAITSVSSTLCIFICVRLESAQNQGAMSLDRKRKVGVKNLLKKTLSLFDLTAASPNHLTGIQPKKGNA